MDPYLPSTNNSLEASLIDELKQPQALPVGLSELPLDEAHTEELELALSYLQAVRAEAAGIPDVVSSDLCNIFLTKEEGADYINTLNDLHTYSKDISTEREIEWEGISLSRFIDLKNQLLSETETRGTPLEGDQLKSYFREYWPSKSFLCQLDSVHICELVEALTEELLENHWEINLQSMAWVFSAFTYLDELMAMDADVAYELQKLRRYLEANVSRDLPKELIGAIKLNIFIIKEHFKQK